MPQKQKQIYPIGKNTKILFTYLGLSLKSVFGVFVALIIGMSVWFFVLKENGNRYETLVIEPGDFIQQIAVAGTVVASDSVDLGFAQTGRVAGIYARVGDNVAAGAVLAKLENDDLHAEVLKKKAAVETAKADLVSLQEGLSPEEIAVLEASIESDKVALDQARQAIMNALGDAYTKADDAVRNKIDQFIVSPRTSNADVMFLLPDRQLETALESGRVSMEGTLVKWKERNANLFMESDLSLMVLYAQNDLKNVSILLADANTALSKAVTSSSVSSANISAWIIDIATARTTVNTAISALTSAVTTQRSAAAALEKDTRNLALENVGASEADIDAQEARVRSAEAEVVQAEAQLAKTLIRAPFSGVITKQDVRVGESVSSGSVLISLISPDALQIESYVPEIHVALLAVGNKAEVILDAYADVVFFASVVSIDPGETVRDGISTYRAVLQFTQQDPRVKTGMTANITLTTEEKSGVISVPRGVVTNRAGGAYVSVKKGDLLEERKVTTGMVSSLGFVEILSGLSPGDVVVLKLAEE